MSVNTKRVFYVKYLSHSIFADLLGARPDVRLDKLENDSAEQAVAPILAAAHAFQIGAARDELARCEALFCEGLAQCLVQKLRKRARRCPARLVHRARLCHIGRR